MHAQPPNPWKCLVCGKEHADPAMARACESRHERDTGPVPVHRTEPSSHTGVAGR
jgi:hypothetical protein